MLKSTPSIRVNGKPISLCLVGDGFSVLRGISLLSLFVFLSRSPEILLLRHGLKFMRIKKLKITNFNY